MVPFDDKSAFTTSGIRLGTAAITTRGLRQDDMTIIAGLINDVVMNLKDETVIAGVRKKVNELMDSKPLFQY